MFVNASIIKKKPKITDTIAAIFIDFDRKTYAVIPRIKHAIAVRVPDWNIAQVQANAVIRNMIRCFLILLVNPKIKNATAVDAIPVPKLAASV